MLKPQDIVVLLALTTEENAASWRQLDIANALNLSQAEVHKSLQRVAQSHLYDPHTKQVIRKNLLEFILHGIKYAFPAQVMGVTKGLPTAWGHREVFSSLAKYADIPVWQHAQGVAIGTAISPLYATVPVSVKSKPQLYRLLAAIDAIRIGKGSEVQIARDYIAAHI